jgi:hypothetical protein
VPSNAQRKELVSSNAILYEEYRKLTLKQPIITHIRLLQHQLVAKNESEQGEVTHHFIECEKESHPLSNNVSCAYRAEWLYTDS